MPYNKSILKEPGYVIELWTISNNIPIKVIAGTERDLNRIIGIITDCQEYSDKQNIVRARISKSDWRIGYSARSASGELVFDGIIGEYNAEQQSSSPSINIIEKYPIKLKSDIDARKVISSQGEEKNAGKTKNADYDANSIFIPIDKNTKSNIGHVRSIMNKNVISGGVILEMTDEQKDAVKNAIGRHKIKIIAFAGT